MRYQHQARFAFVSKDAFGLTIADVACGDGSGAREMLARGARRVDCFDISSTAIAVTRQRLADAHSICCIADAGSLPVRDATYDRLVSLETIEHLADDEAFLDEVVRVVKPGGSFICSTPNRDLLDPGTSICDQPFNRFHVREYCVEELRALLASRFSSIEWLGQSFYNKRYVRVLAVLGRLSPRFAVRLHQAKKLICSIGDSPRNHQPTAMRDGCEPEIFITVCRR